MNTEETKRLIEGRKLLDAVIDGRELEARRNGRWITYSARDWGSEPDWGTVVRHPELFRVKPEPTYRPWTPKEVPVGSSIVSKHTGSIYLILAVEMESKEVKVSCIGSPGPEQLFQSYTQLDGSPCGVLE